MDGHPTCAECGKRLVDFNDLKNHEEEHVRFKCNVCGNEILSKEKAVHMEMHVRQDLFKKTLENGKTLKKPKAKTDVKTATGYNVFVKMNHSKLKDQNPGLTTDQVRKLVGAEWKSLGVVGQQVYKDLARNSGEVQETQATNRTDGVSQGQGRTNQLNRITPDADQGRIHACNMCGALYSGSAELENHKMMTHSSAGPSPQSQAAVVAELIAVVDAADAAEDGDSVENTAAEDGDSVENTAAAVEVIAEEEDGVDAAAATVEVEATVEESCVEIVMVMMRTTMWPAVVVRREEVEDDRPSALPLRKVTVDIFSKGERIVSERDISPYPPANKSSNRKPKDWKNAMKMAELAAKDL